MTDPILVALMLTLVGIGGFLIGYGWAAWLEEWSER